MIAKTIKSKTEYFIDFTDEELESLNIKKGDKFSVDANENEIILKKYESIEIDLSEFSKESLIKIINEANEKDITISEYFETILTNFIDKVDSFSDKYIK